MLRHAVSSLLSQFQDRDPSFGCVHLERRFKPLMQTIILLTELEKKERFHYAQIKPNPSLSSQPSHPRKTSIAF